MLSVSGVVEVLASYLEYWYFAIMLFKTHRILLSYLKKGRKKLIQNYSEMPGDWFILCVLAKFEGLPLEVFKVEMCRRSQHDEHEMLLWGSLVVYVVYMVATFCLILNFHNFVKRLIFN